MPNLIGTGNNQVPTNGMLGGLAYQSPDNVVIKNLELTNLSGHNSVIPSNAVDVFVYDTRKDSDGGAWRKRTQNTSWYNETLNTATRGSRKDFPAVAVIVAKTDTLTIYDGDDPDLPMWMVFNQSSNNMFFNTNTGTSVSACNGILSLGTNGAIWVAHFVSDRGDLRNSTRRYDYRGYISQRNSGLSYTDQETSGAIISNSVNDVAMTVLPNAPIDPSTGLPVPTIAVATNGGTSIIRDDGTVVSGGEDNASWRVGELFFDNDNTIWATEGSDYSPGVQLMSQVPYSTVNSIGVGILGYQLTTQQTTDYGRNTSWPYVLGPFGAYQNRHSSSKTEIYTSSLGGLTFIQDNSSNRANSMVAYATTSYNTGWMHGDIKGAWLSDTSTASVTGTELVTNGTFSTSDLSAWTTIAGGTAVITGGLLKLTDTSNAFVYASAPFSTVVGKKYVVTFDIVNNGDNTANYNYVRIGNSHNSTEHHDTNYGTSYGKYQVTITASATTTYITLINGLSNGLFGYWDNVSARLAEPDRSVNNKGLAVYGTITKTPVATGSNLVDYGNFGASNYLFQPYNSALDFGTGDFCYMCWVKDDSVSAGAVIFQRGAAVNSNETVFYIDSSYRLIGRVQTLSSALTSNVCFVEGQWNHCVFLRRSGTTQIYHNGILQGSATNTETATQVGQGLSIGAWLTNNNYFPTSISLFRVSSTAPSPEQILKIYNDEKALFQPNSQCTLYGSSDAVTALAYDDTTKLLSVGTSSGRSDFQGLERINNTTTAVTTAISASNGLIAEQ